MNKGITLDRKYEYGLVVRPVKTGLGRRSPKFTVEYGWKENNMSEEKLTINIPVGKYIEFVDKLEEKDLDIADYVHILFLNHMTPASTKLYFAQRYNK